MHKLPAWGMPSAPLVVDTIGSDAATYSSASAEFHPQTKDRWPHRRPKCALANHHKAPVKTIEDVHNTSVGFIANHHLVQVGAAEYEGATFCNKTNRLSVGPIVQCAMKDQKGTVTGNLMLLPDCASLVSSRLIGIEIHSVRDDRYSAFIKTNCDKVSTIILTHRDDLIDGSKCENFHSFDPGAFTPKLSQANPLNVAGRWKKSAAALHASV